MTDFDRTAEPIAVSDPTAEGVATVLVCGDLDTDAFAAAIARAEATGAQTVVADLSGVRSFSVEAAAVLPAYRYAGRTGSGRLLLCPSPVVKRKLELLGLTEFLTESTVGSEKVR